MNNRSTQINIAYLLLSIFAAFASYRLHLEGFEEVIGEGLDAIIDGNGRAPDQYRILPYLVLGTIREILSPVFGPGWKYPVLIFESLSLFGSILILGRLAPGTARHPLLIVLILLTYPYLMFDGVRSAASFILLFSCATLLFCNSKNSTKQRIGFYFTLLAFSFARADIALLVGLVCSVYMMQSFLEKLLTAAIPIVVQILLIQLIYPNAEYYSEIVMVADNITLSYFINNPTTYFLAGLLVIYWSQVRDFMGRLYAAQPLLIFLIAGYVATVFIVGRPNEYRLFLPLLPVILLILERQKLNTRGH